MNRVSPNCPCWCWLLIPCLISVTPLLWAESSALDDPTDEKSDEKTVRSDLDSGVEEEYQEPPRLPEPDGLKAMPKPHRVWIDTQRKQVIVDGYVSLNEGLLEMFACTSGTKEHESIVAVLCSAQIVHAALLAVGAEAGHPVRWEEKFEPPTGTEIAIEVRWLDEAGKWKSMPAQRWLKDLNTKKPMAHSWVFAGSGFWKDEETGKEYYLAESGDFICVSNFSTATLDIPVESSQANDGLLFEAHTKNIPPVGTPVRLVLKPKLPQAKVQPPE
jgi:hypothetical protein